MNKFYRKAAAVITAGIMAATSFCAESFAAETTAASGSVTVAYGANTTVAKPTYTIKGSKGVRKILLKTATSGATIYYTTNGTVPTSNSYKYTAGTLLKITKDIKIRAVAIKDGVSSDVMTKTFKVATMVGDVTGDGRVNNNDYKRFNSLADGKTTYYCTDNLDCDGNGKITRKDITVLLSYLNSEISALPYTGAAEAEDPEGSDDGSSVPTNTTSSGSSSSSSSANVTLAAPGITVYKAYGGKKVEFESSISGGTFYYTTNGTNPTTSSTKYSGRFLVDRSCTVKVIVAKGNEISRTQSINITVDQTSAVTTSVDTTKVYSGSVNVDLNCTTADSRIYYTTDGTDPKTSSTAKLYSGAFRVNTTTDVKAYAQAKCCADSNTASFRIRFSTDGFTLSGIIYEDKNANNSRESSEGGISGLNVYAYNVDTKTYAATTRTGAAGDFSFTGLRQGSNYQVIAEFSGVQYRPANQSLLVKTYTSPLIIKNGGAYDLSGSRVSTENRLTDALKSSRYTISAYTGRTYSESDSNCNLPLVPMDTSFLSVSISSSGISSQNAVKNGDRVAYTVTLTNNSLTQTLSDVGMGVYFNANVLSQYSFSGATCKENDVRADGYRYCSITNIIGSSGLGPGKSVSFQVSGTISGQVGNKLACYAEVVSYRFENPIFDCYSIPGNLSVGGYTNYGEKDEAISTTAVVSTTTSSGSSSDAYIVYSGPKTFTLNPGEIVDVEFTVMNLSSPSDCSVSFVGEPTYARYYNYSDLEGTTLTAKFRIVANSVGNAGQAMLVFRLNNNSSQYLSLRFNVNPMS